MPGNYCRVMDFGCTAIFSAHCDTQFVSVCIACVIYVIIYSKRPLLRLRPLPSNYELSVAKAHCVQNALRDLAKIAVKLGFG